MKLTGIDKKNIDIYICVSGIKLYICIRKIYIASMFLSY